MSDDGKGGGFMGRESEDFSESRLHRDFADPDFEPGEFDVVERRLRRDLRSEGGRIEPHDRLESILAEAHAGGSAGNGSTPPRRWLAPLAAAAAVALVGGAAWLTTRDSTTPAPPAATSTTNPVMSPSPTSPAPTTSTTGSTATAGTTLALPAYFVGRTGDDGGFGLYREFIRATVPATTDDAKARAAVALAMSAQPFGAEAGYLQAWGSTRVEGVTVTAARITVSLSGPGGTGLDREVQRLAVQQLVWTAQAAVGKGTIPVTFRLGDGSSALFGRFPAAALYNRPPTPEYYRDLAPVWITQPTRGQAVKAGTRIHLAGEACVFEATLQWSLTRGDSPVRNGMAMASIGAPGRGTWAVDLPPLDAGTYTVSAWWASPKDGSVLDRTAVTFTVE